MNNPLKETAKIPVSGQGSFWENRGDRHHCGIDLYAKVGEEIFALADGEVMAIELMTHPGFRHYWNITYQMVIKSKDFYIKYGEIQKPELKVGDLIKKGQSIARVGQVLDGAKIGPDDPAYVQKLKEGKNAMLHLECWKNKPITVHGKYLGGNWFDENKPENLMDPAFLFE